MLFLMLDITKAIPYQETATFMMLVRSTSYCFHRSKMPMLFLKLDITKAFDLYPESTHQAAPIRESTSSIHSTYS